MRGKQLPFWFTTIALLIGLPLPLLIQYGMFMDAILYTCVGRNLAEGIGTFWFPVFSESGVVLGVPSFHEQPPLGFWIMSLFFQLLGNGWYVERLYVFVTFFISAVLIIAI